MNELDGEETTAAPAGTVESTPAEPAISEAATPVAPPDAPESAESDAPTSVVDASVTSTETPEDTGADSPPDSSESGPTDTSVQAAGSEAASSEPDAALGGLPQRLVDCLLAVRRSVVWAGRQDYGAPQMAFIGVASLRLLKPFVGTPDVELSALFEQLDALDSTAPRSRRRVLGRIRRAIDSVLGEQAPARPRRTRRSRESPRASSRRDGRGQARSEARAKVSRAEAEAPSVEDSVAEAEADPESDSESMSGRGMRKRRRGRRRSTTEEPSRKVEEVPEPEKPRRPTSLPLGHPDGTGKPVGELGTFDDVELEALAEVDIHTIADLLTYAPPSHARATRVSIGGVQLDEPVIVRGPIRWRLVRVTAHGRRWEVGIGEDNSPALRLRWFRRPPRGWDSWEDGTEIGVYGEVREAEDGPTMYEAEPLGPRGQGSGMLPVYDIPGVDDSRVRDGIAAALDSTVGTLRDWLPSGVRDQHRLLSLDEALRDAHFPANATRRGRVRLAFDELFTIQVGVAWRSGRGKPARGIAHKPVHTGIGQIESQHQIRLDDAQELAFSEIRRDLVRPVPMNRLLQGDVGSGKGLVAQMAALMVVGGGCQAAMVYPDVLAAERRFLHIDPILRSIGIKTLLIADDRLDRAQIDAIRRGEAQIVFGTQSILQKAVTWKRLGLVTVEERGPYGTLDIESLAKRGTRPDLLVIPRAPIPSSLAFTVFGDFDVSTLHGSPQRPVKCDVFQTAARQEAYASLREVVEAGRQGYVVFPVRDGRDLLSVDDAVRTAQALRKDLLPGARMGVYSSEMSREERSRVFDDFQQRRIDVLVCTTYIEDSPEVTNATAMVVEYADLHDLVRLHRLRAHVSGGYKAGSCAFITSDEPSPQHLERLEQLISERDGFRLAELDLQIRGATAVLGNRATEAPDFRWADPPEDRGLFLRARGAAFDLIRRDPELRSAGGVAETVNFRWGDWLGHALPRAATKKRGDGRRRRRKRR